MYTQLLDIGIFNHLSEEKNPHWYFSFSSHSQLELEKFLKLICLLSFNNKFENVCMESFYNFLSVVGLPLANHDPMNTPISSNFTFNSSWEHKLISMASDQPSIKYWNTKRIRYNIPWHFKIIYFLMKLVKNVECYHDKCAISNVSQSNQATTRERVGLYH